MANSERQEELVQTHVPNQQHIYGQDDEVEDFVNSFRGFDGHYGDSLKIDEEDGRLVEAFLSKDAAPQPTLADIIEFLPERGNPDRSTVEYFNGVGKYLSKYRARNIPMLLARIPSMLPSWEEALSLTHPENWSPNAMYQATRIFSEDPYFEAVQDFYRLVLLPRVRQDIRQNEHLHLALHRSLRKSLRVRPAAFFNGILFPLCQSRTCTLREAVIVGSVLQEASVPPFDSSAALLELAKMEYCGSTSYFINLLLEKNYALRYQAVEALVAHFTSFLETEGVMPRIWHQSLLAFVQRCQNELHMADKEKLRLVLEKKKHELVTHEISMELNDRCNLREKDD